MSNAPKRVVRPEPEEPVEETRFSEFEFDADGQAPDDDLPDEAPGFGSGAPKFSKWLENEPIDPTYHDHVGPLRPDQVFPKKGGR